MAVLGFEHPWEHGAHGDDHGHSDHGGHDDHSGHGRSTGYTKGGIGETPTSDV